MKDAALYTVKKAGDGTTAAIVFANSLVQHGIDILKDDAFNSRELVEGINLCKKLALDYIKANAKKIKINSDDLRFIATTSCNSNEKLGNIIADAINQIGMNGIIQVEKNNLSEESIYFEKTNGYFIKRGYKTSAIPASKSGLQFTLHNPIVAMFTDPINAKTEYLEHAINYAEQNSLPLIILTLKAAPVMADYLTRYLENSNIEIFIVEMSTAIEEMRDQYLDLFAISGTGDILNDISKISKESFAYFDKVIISENKTIFINNEKNNLVDERIKEIKSAKKLKKGTYFENWFNERIAKLQNGVGTLYINAPTTPEMNRLVDLLDDGIRATQSALKEGILVGGGKAYLNIQPYIESIANKNNIGVKVFLKALESPIRQILKNSDETTRVLELVRTKEYTGYDVITRKTFDFMKIGIIDPALVIKSVIESATTAANTILSSGAIIYNEDYEGTGMSVQQFLGE